MEISFPSICLLINNTFAALKAARKHFEYLIESLVKIVCESATQSGFRGFSNHLVAANCPSSQ